MSKHHEEEQPESDTPKRRELQEKLREWANNTPGASEGFLERVMEEAKKRPVPYVPGAKHSKTAIDRVQAEREQEDIERGL